jgi:serine/threonine-protein kinase
MPVYKPPPRFAGYEVHELLGKGGMASVYRGVHVLLQRAVAIKFLHGGMAAGEAGQRRFLREARLVAKLSHPNIVTVFDFGQLDDGTYYQASELVPGVTLREHLRGGPLAPARALDFARQLAEGLASAHAVGVIHRDLKPSNVMVVPDPALAGGLRLKLLDFGIAKSLSTSSQITEIGAWIGTPGYMAPEQCRGLGEVGLATDIYSLGVVLYVMLCGAPPFTASDSGGLLDLHRRAPPPRPSERCGCSPALDALVLRCMAKTPSERPPSMAAVIAAIDALSADDRTIVDRTAVDRVAPSMIALPADDGPRTLQLPVEPISVGEPLTSTATSTTTATVTAAELVTMSALVAMPTPVAAPASVAAPAPVAMPVPVAAPAPVVVPAPMSAPVAALATASASVPRLAARPLLRGRRGWWALSVTAAAVALALAVIALAAWRMGASTVEQASPPTTTPATAAGAVTPAPAAPISAESTSAAPAPAAPISAESTSAAPAPVAPISAESTSAAPAPAAPISAESRSAAPAPAASRVESPRRNRASSKPRKPDGRASTKPSPPTRDPLLPPTSPPSPTGDRSFERPVF